MEKVRRLACEPNGLNPIIGGRKAPSEEGMMAQKGCHLAEKNISKNNEVLKGLTVVFSRGPRSGFPNV